MSQNQSSTTGNYHRAKEWEIAFFSLNNSATNFLSPRHGGEFNQAFYTEFLGGVMILSAILTTLAVIGIRRKDRTEYFGLGEDTVETKSVKDYWSVIKGNKPLQVLAISGV